MRDVLVAGPFHSALRAAIAARGLSLDRLRDRLADGGLPIGVSTLSNWQRGVSRPQRAESMQVVAALERLLDLADGTLVRLLAEPADRGRGRFLVPGTPSRPATRLRALLDEPADPGLDRLATRMDVTVTGTGFHMTVHTVVRARRSGVDRHVLLAHGSGGPLPEFRAGRDCAIGRVTTDPEAALIAAELLFPPLGQGETLALEHQLVGAAADFYYGRWFRGAGECFELTIRFDPEIRAARGYRIWRLDSGSPHKDVARLRLIDGRILHLADFDVSPGFHGIRWIRDPGDVPAPGKTGEESARDERR